MFYLVKESDSNDYILFETKNRRISIVYKYNSNSWIPLRNILLAKPFPYSDSPVFRTWKAISPDTIIYSSRSLSGIHKFIHNSPELLI